MFVNPNKMWIVYMSIFLYFNTSIAQHVYTSIRIYVYMGIRLYTLHLFFYIYFYLSFHFRFWFRPHFSSACGHPSTFILQRYRRQRTRQTPECSPIGRKLFMTLRNQRLRFPENFASQLFALCPLNACDLTLHIKGSR